MVSGTSTPIAEIENIANTLIQSGKPQEAIDQLNRASEDLMGYPSLYRLKGISCLMLGHNTEAKAIFDQLEGSFGDDPDFLNVFGIALRRERELAKAQEIYQRGIELNPDHPALLSNFGNLLIDLGHFKIAKTYLEKAIQLKPDHHDAKQNLARLERSLGQSNPDTMGSSNVVSESSYSRPDSINRDEQAATDWLKLAANAQRNKNYEEAFAFAKKSIESQVDLGAAYKLAGEVLISLQRYQEAERALLYGLFFEEIDASAATNLAILSAMKGYNDLAKSFFNEALKLQPAHELAITNLKNLEAQEAQGSYVRKSVI